MKRPAKEHPNPEHWKQLREKVFLEWNGRCAAISEHIAEDLHHRHYDTWGEETSKDLIPLCKLCHEAITNIQRGERYEKESSPKFYEPVRPEPPKPDRFQGSILIKQSGKEISNDVQTIRSENWRGYVANAQFSNSRSIEPFHEEIKEFPKKEN